MADASDTLRTVKRHNRLWGAGDVPRIVALYHPDMVLVEHATGQRFQHAALHERVVSVLRRSSLATLQYLDRVRVDGDTAFMRYTEVIRSADGRTLMTFTACDVVRVNDGLIVEIHEYAMPQDAAPADRKPSRSLEKIGLSPRALGYLLADVTQYFTTQQPYLKPQLTLDEVARTTGYSRNQISYALNHGMGKTFYQYLQGARIAHLLSNPDLMKAASPTDMAAAVGFRSLSTFYGAFREATGCSPQQYLSRSVRAATDRM